MKKILTKLQEKLVYKQVQQNIIKFRCKSERVDYSSKVKYVHPEWFIEDIGRDIISDYEDKKGYCIRNTPQDCPMTEHIRKLKSYSKCSHNSNHDRNWYKFETLNPKPDFIRGDFDMLFGTFIDYMIRKMLKLEKEEVREDYIIAEVAKDLLAENIRNASQYDNLETWIKQYYENDDWQGIVESTFYMAQIDQLYRRGELLPLVRLQNEQIQTIEVFLTKVEEYIMNIDFLGTIRLNPSLSYGNTLADCDIIDDEKIYDIKTSSYRPRMRDFRQILVYTALNWKLNDYLVKNMVILNPVKLVTYSAATDKISLKDLQKIIDALE